MTMSEIHLTNRQRERLGELLLGGSPLGACSIKSEGSDVVVLFDGATVVISETGGADWGTDV